MKTKVEIEGYEIEIEFSNGVISVKAEKDDEIVEEFSIEVEEGEGQGQEEVQDFDEFGQDEEEDFESDEENEDEEFEGEEDEDEDSEERAEMPALESFQSFINKKRKK